jgi:hypothetical protein
MDRRASWLDLTGMSLVAESKHSDPGSRSHFRNNPKGGGNPPPVHRLEPVIAVDFGLVDEYPYFHFGQKIFSPVDRQTADYWLSRVTIGFFDCVYQRLRVTARAARGSHLVLATIKDKAEGWNLVPQSVPYCSARPLRLRRQPFGPTAQERRGFAGDACCGSWDVGALRSSAGRTTVNRAAGIAAIELGLLRFGSAALGRCVLALNQFRDHLL